MFELLFLTSIALVIVGQALPRADRSSSREPRSQAVASSRETHRKRTKKNPTSRPADGVHMSRIAQSGYSTSSNSTSKIRAELGGMTGGAPFSA